MPENLRSRFSRNRVDVIYSTLALDASFMLMFSYSTSRLLILPLEFELALAEQSCSRRAAQQLLNIQPIKDLNSLDHLM
jgi:hypothetical protein